MRRLFLLALIVVLGVPILGTSLASASATRCGRGMDNIYIHNFELEVSVEEKTYSIGETALFHVNVTTPGTDPAGTGVPMPRPTTQPAAGASVGIGLHIGRVYLPGGGVTDENGEAKIGIKLEDYAPPDKVVDATVYATRLVTFVPPCLYVYEDGYKPFPKAFRTTD